MKRTVQFAACMCLCLAGCGGGDDDVFEGGEHKVNEVRINGEQMRVGEAIRVDVYFETESDFDGPDDIEVAVELPPELDYEVGSSEIYEGDDDDRDARSPDDFLVCPGGKRFLFYSFDGEDDLEGRDFGSSNFRFRFNVIGRAVTPVAIIRAAASENISYSCLGPFDAEDEDKVAVLP